MDRLLLIETSGRVGQVGLAHAAGIVAQQRLDEAQKHARDLVPAAARLQQEQGWRAQQIEAVFVSLGPGSYTGLRVGVMSAKALAFATGCKLVGVPTFNVLAVGAARQLGAMSGAAVIEVTEDAQQGRVYAQRFSVSACAEVVELTSLEVLEHQQWLSRIEADIYLTGPGLHRKYDHLPQQQKVMPPTAWEPNLADLHALGLARLALGAVDDPLKLEPIYARASAAEVQWTALGR